MRIPKIFLIGPLPPPHNGQSLAFSSFYNHLIKNNIKPVLINIGGDVKGRKDGSFSFVRLGILLLPMLRAFKFLVSRKNTMYLTISQSFNGFLRDSFFIFMAWLGSYKIILHLHGGNYTGLYNSVSCRWKRTIKWILSKSDKIVVLGHGLKGDFEFLNNEKTELVTVPNGISIGSSRNRVFKQLPQKHQEPIRILYLSNMIESKGYLDVLEAVNLLKNDFNIPVEASFCGEFLITAESKLYQTPSSAQEDFNNRIKINNLERNVVWNNFVSGENKVKEFEKAHFFILPTYYENEGQPLSIIEAMAFGCYVITTKYRAIPDLIEVPRQGSFVNACSPKEIARDIQAILKTPLEFESASKNNMERFLNNFSEDKYNANLEKVIFSEDF